MIGRGVFWIGSEVTAWIVRGVARFLVVVLVAARSVLVILFELVFDTSASLIIAVGIDERISQYGYGRDYAAPNFAGRHNPCMFIPGLRSTRTTLDGPDSAMRAVSFVVILLLRMTVFMRIGVELAHAIL